MKIGMAVAISALLAVCAGPAMAQEGDAARGQTIAQNDCAQCHAIAKADLYSPQPNAPPFAKLANTAGINARALRVALHTAHTNMPNLIVEDAEIDDLAAYLATLR